VYDQVKRVGGNTYIMKRYPYIGHLIGKGRQQFAGLNSQERTFCKSQLQGLNWEHPSKLVDWDLPVILMLRDQHLVN